MRALRAKRGGVCNVVVVVSRGQMGWPDYEMLLTEYFVGDFDNYDDFTYNMYIHTVIRRFEYSLMDSKTMPQILFNMVRVVKGQEGKYQCRTRQPGLDDDAWINSLWAEDRTLTREHGPTFRQLLHVFEHHYSQGNLIGNQSRIRRYLHDSLQTAHNGVKACEEINCQWLPGHHACGATDWNDIPDTCGILSIPRMPE